VLLVYLIAALWRIMVYQGRWSFPGRYTKALLAVTCFGGIGFHYRTLIGLEPTVALLLAAYALKLVELVDRKDAYIAIFLAYFVCVTEFLFSQDLLITLYMLFAVLLITTSLVALHQPGQDSFTRTTLRRASIMLAQAFPLMIVLFFIFPRIGPLWSVPLKGHTAKSGVSDFMAPGDISNLSLSDEVAFRVQFDGDIPPRNQLYWRGLVFSKLQGRAWRSLRWREVPATERRQVPPETGDDAQEYSVLLEPTQQNWLYALPYARSPDLSVVATNDFRLVSPVEVQDQKRYEVRSWLGVVLEPSLSEWREEVETNLPLYGSPRARELALDMYAAAGGDTAVFSNDILRMFRQQEFYYTLEPPLLGDNPVDDFLFGTRRGFCEHYAAAFAFVMRAAGVPARVIAGYQGGEINPVNGTVIVHQFDAHAWNEIWIEGLGWTRVDPTGAIAPDRIEYGLEQALAGEGSFLADSPLSPLRFRNIDWINSVRLRLDAITYSWQRFVLQYNSEEQYQLLTRVLGEVNGSRLAAVFVGAWCLVLIPLAINLLRRSRGRQLDPATRLYHEFCRKLRSADLARGRSEAPGDFALRVSLLRPELAAEVESISRAYDAICYRDQGGAEAIDLLKKQVRKFNPR
jgi:transglutaminase-like putative cysteine protease